MRLTAAVVLVVLGGCGSQSSSTSGSSTSSSDTTKLAVVVGGPHPYFAPMPDVVKAAKNDFHIAEATYRVPTTFTLNSGTTFLSKDTAANYLGAAQTLTQQIQQRFKSKYLSC